MNPTTTSKWEVYDNNLHGVPDTVEDEGGYHQQKDLSALEDRIRTVTFQKRIRINEFFKDFDPLRSGYVSQPQFRRCLNMCGVNLTNVEAQLLLDTYLDKERQKVHYVRFTDNIDQVFTVKNLEKKPLESLFTIQPVLQATRTPKEPQTYSVTELRELLERLKREASIMGYVVKHFFYDFDLHNHGVVTRCQFIQCIPFRNLNEKEMRIILERYTTSSGDVNYMLFHNEIEGNDESNIVIKSSRGGQTTGSDACHLEAESVEDLIRKQLLKYNLKLEEVFRDFDPLRSGFITKPQFISSLGTIKFHKLIFSEKELNSVAEKYRVEDDNSRSRVAYMEFLTNMNKVFNYSNLEKYPQRRFEQPNHLLKTCKQSLNQKSMSDLEEILARIKHATLTKRILLKPFFQDFDKTLKGTFSTKHVTKTRFERVLAMIGITLTVDQYNLLTRRYDDLNDGTVNYVMFLEDVDEVSMD